MFSYSSNLTILDLNNFNTSNVTDMGWMFIGCSLLIELDISNFTFNSVTDNSHIFDHMRADAIVKVKDKSAQDWILALSSNDRPAEWTTENVVIKE